jgi:hypothetical protein
MTPREHLRWRELTSTSLLVPTRYLHIGSFLTRLHKERVPTCYHLTGFKAKGSLMNPERLLDIWTELTTRHGLLAATIEYENVNEVRFW